MREIKLRVWEAISKRIGAVTEIHFGNNPYIRAEFHKKETPEERLLRAVFGVKAKHILMQYTGLKDKNGKEIYEGDIVQFLIHRKLVEWSQEEARFTCPGAVNGEVIGNIYENPELLENN